MMIKIAAIAGSDASGRAGLEAEQLSRIKEISAIEQMKEAARIIHGKGAIQNLR
jgi:hydroxymethylpyrimidine/phosphomethylpyrimidine kinase